jgi:hypothetical protein
VLGLLEHRLRPGERRVRVLQVRGRVDRAAVLAGIAVLVLRAALRAFALDVAVGRYMPFTGSKNCSIVFVSMKPLFFRASKIEFESSRSSSECVV